MIDLASGILICVSAIAVGVSVVLGIHASRQKRAFQADVFESRYGSSVDRMVTECEVDRVHLKMIRDADRSGPAKAVRELRRTDPVPLAAAAEFIRRI